MHPSTDTPDSSTRGYVYFQRRASLAVHLPVSDQQHSAECSSLCYMPTWHARTTTPHTCSAVVTLCSTRLWRRELAGRFGQNLLPTIRCIAAQGNGNALALTFLPLHLASLLFHSHLHELPARLSLPPASLSMSTSVLKVDVLMEGYLHKRSPKQLLTLAIHQRRYFLLTSSLTTTHHQHFHLSYFRSHDHHIPLGHIPLSHVQSLRPSQEENGRFDVVMSGMAGGEGRVYVLRCENALEYSRWMEQLKRAMDEEGKRRPLPPPTSAPATFRGEYRESTVVAEERRDERRKSQWNVKDALDLMLAGTPVTLVTPSTATPNAPSAFPTIFTPSILLYKHDDTPLGSLYWFDAHTTSAPTLSTSSRLSLHNLTDIFLGKQSRAYTATLPSTAAAASGTAGAFRADCCFSACTKVGVSLHVCGHSREVVSAWVYGINSIMMSKGQRKIRTKDKGASGGGRHGSITRFAGVPASPSFSSTRSTSQSVSDRLNVHPAEEFYIADTKRPSLSTPRTSGIGLPFTYSTAANVDNAAKNRRADVALRDWLEGLGSAFSGYYDSFVDNGVDLAFLATLNTADLDELGVTRLHGKRMLQSIRDWRAKQDDGEANDERKVVVGSMSAPTSASNSLRSSGVPPTASALLAALSAPSPSSSLSPTRSPFFPPPPIHPQLARRESMPVQSTALVEMKRLSLEGALNERLKGELKAGSGVGLGAAGGLSGRRGSSTNDGVKNYFGSVWSGLVSGGSTPKGLQQSASVKRSVV